MMKEAASPENTPQVRAILESRIAGLAEWLEARERLTAHQTLALGDIRRWQERPEGLIPPADAAELPPGSPIGSRRN